MMITRMVTRWAEATAMKLSSDQAMEFGYDGDATNATAWNRDAIDVDWFRVEWREEVFFFFEGGGFGGKNKSFIIRCKTLVRILIWCFYLERLSSLIFSLFIPVNIFQYKRHRFLFLYWYGLGDLGQVNICHWNFFLRKIFS